MNKKKTYLISIAVLMFFALTQTASQAAEWFVDNTCEASGNGTTWGTAFITIQEGIDAEDVADYDVIRVKDVNPYVLTTQINVNKAVTLIGENNSVTVDGNHLVRCFRITDDATIKGFIIKHGKAIGDGGGIDTSNCSPTIENCEFDNNTALGIGGGLHTLGGSPTVEKCTFIRNSANIDGGGIHFCQTEDTITITNCLLYGNSAQIGGGIYLQACADVKITNLTFSENNRATEHDGAAIGGVNSSADITNCILWDNNGEEITLNGSSSISVSYSNIDQDGYEGSNGNIRQNPIFAGNYHLTSGSPCIDAGTSFDAPDDDLDECGRDSSPDMGAYEFECTPSTSTTTASSSSTTTSTSSSSGGSSSSSGGSSSSSSSGGTETTTSSTSTTTTIMSCTNDTDCNDSVFCNGAEICVAGECYSVVDPCQDDEFCDEENDECLTFECDFNSDCDDDLFCNGAEQCDEGFCVAGENPCPQNKTCREEQKDCWDGTIIYASCLLKKINKPLFTDKKCSYLIIKQTGDNHFDNNLSILSVEGANENYQGVTINSTRSAFKLWRFILVPICIEKGATVGDWTIKIETDLGDTENPFTEIIEAKFQIK